MAERNCLKTPEQTVKIFIVPALIKMKLDLSNLLSNSSASVVELVLI